MDATDDRATFNVDMGVDLMVGLTLLRTSLALSLEEMLRMKGDYSFLAHGEDLREMSEESLKALLTSGAELSLVRYEEEEEEEEDEDAINEEDLSPKIETETR